MKKVIVAVAVLALSLAARATPITGVLVLAGLDTFTPTGITFQNPPVVLEATGVLSPIMESATPLMLDNRSGYTAEAGTQLFSWSSGGSNITALMDTFVVTRDSQNFLNVLGVITLSATGFDPTIYDFSLTSTKPDGVTSFTIDLTPLAPVGEPAPLFLVGTGLLLMGWLYWMRKRHGQSLA